MKNILVCSMLLLTLSSCTRVVGLMVGLKQPTLVTENEILITAKDWGIDSNEVYLPEKNYFFYDTNFVERKSLPAIFIYDKNGVRLRNGGCINGIKSPDYFSFQNLQKDSLSANLFEKLQHYNFASSQGGVKNGDADYFITVNWATFAKGFHKRNAKQLAAIKSGQKPHQIRTLYLNLDFRKSFFEEEDGPKLSERKEEG